MTGVTPQPAQLSGTVSQELLPQAMFLTPTPSHNLQHPGCCSQPDLLSLAEHSLSHASGHAEDAELLRFGAQPVSHFSPASSRQVPAQLPTPVQLSPSWDRRPGSCAKLPLTQYSPVSSRQVSAELLTKLPVPPPASRDPRRRLYPCTAVDAALPDPKEGLGLIKDPNHVDTLRHSQQQTQISEPMLHASSTQSALLATTVVPDCPDTRSILKAGDTLAIVPSRSSCDREDIQAAGQHSMMS